MIGISVFNQSEHFQTATSATPICVGRVGGDAHVQINDQLVSAKQLQIEPCEKPGFVRISNHGYSVSTQAGQRIHRHQSVELALPASLFAGSTHLQVFDAAKTSRLDDAIEEIDFKNQESTSQNTTAHSPSPLTLEAWFEAISQLHKSVAGSHEFFAEAARAIHTPGGLDGGMILSRSKQDWKIEASFIPSPEFGTAFRSDLADRVLETGKSVFHSATLAAGKNYEESHDSCILIPVFKNGGEIANIIYGFRRQNRKNNRKGIRSMEAQFLRLIADSVSVALDRMDREADAARKRILLEQAFSPEVALQLETNTDILSAQTREVSILFADMRDFTTISERVGTSETYRLLGEVMDQFSEIIHRHKGVIIDFYGDGVSAFWNSPMNQPNHALLACRAATEIAKCTEELSKIWHSRIGQALRVGIGVNTGTAQVGNSGSSRRLKYGPRGSAINIASRLESSTKEVGIPIVVSENTANAVAEQFESRRICTTLLKGLTKPISLYELADMDNDRMRKEEWKTYSRALDAVESERFAEAIQLLTELQLANNSDFVSEYLLNRAIAMHRPIEAANRSVETPPVTPIVKSALPVAESSISSSSL